MVTGDETKNKINILVTNAIFFFLEVFPYLKIPKN